MSTTDLNVGYVANLARLQLSDEEISRFELQLAEILQYVKQLENVDVEGIEATAHSSEMFNVFREDVAKASLPPEVVLSNAPRQANGLFVVPKVIE